VIALAPGILERSFEHLRRCGAGVRECVAVWAGPLDQDGWVCEVIHPRHTASAVRCDFDPVWIGEFWLDLAERNMTARAQIHSHPGSAYHSERDDAFALVQTPGYLSLVVPQFAAGPPNLDGAYLAEKMPGGWRELDPSTAIEVSW
jgi:proteasome lid subunit RPN8/RPN11